MVVQQTQIGSSSKSKSGQKLSRLDEVKRQYEAQQEEIAKIEALEREDEEEDKK